MHRKHSVVLLLSLALGIVLMLHAPTVTSQSSFTAKDPGVLDQGHSVFQFNTNEGQCQVRLGREAAARGRNVGVACPSQQSNRGIA